MFYNGRTRLAALAQRQLSAIYGNRGFVDAGGLLTYGPNLPALFRRAAGYVDKILRRETGEPPRGAAHGI